MKWMALLACLVLACSSDGGGSGGAGGAGGAGGTGGAGGAMSDAASSTWSNFAQGFFTTYCTSCHHAGNTNRDYTQFSQVQRDAMLIACGVWPGPAPYTGCGASPAPNQFPIGSGPKPSADERTRLVEWIAAGLPM
jgi:hypothetical protein